MSQTKEEKAAAHKATNAEKAAEKAAAKEEAAASKGKSKSKENTAADKAKQEALEDEHNALMNEKGRLKRKARTKATYVAMGEGQAAKEKSILATPDRFEDWVASKGAKGGKKEVTEEE